MLAPMRSNADSTAPNLDVIYIDNHLLVVRKPSGMLAQGDRTGDRSLLEYGKAYVKAAFNKPGDAFLGLVHRLDRPTSGVMVFARTSKAAARLSEQFRARRIGKIYWALVEGKTPREGRMVDTLLRAGPSSTVSERGQEAVLGFRRLRFERGISWVEVRPKTGRHHQIRVQFAHRGHPVVGDFRYGARIGFPEKSLALHARALTLSHPTRKEEMTFTAAPEVFWPAKFR